MQFHYCLLLAFLHPHLTTSRRPTVNNNATLELTKFLTHVNVHLAELYNHEIYANWRIEIKGPNDLYALLQSEISSANIMTYIHSIAPRRAKFKRLNIGNAEQKRQLALVPLTGYEALNTIDLNLMYEATTNMANIYQRTKLCAFHNPNQCDLMLIPDVQNILHNTRNIAEIEYYWIEWRRKTGAAAKSDFVTFVELYRKTAKLNGFNKPSEFWFKDLEEDSSQSLELLQDFMSSLKPLFEQLHAYVRAELRSCYNAKLIPYKRPYPQHLAEILIGNAYRHDDSQWFIDFPYPKVNMPNITAALWVRGLNNAQRVFWNVQDYFRSLGMPQLEDDFWSNSARERAKTDDNFNKCWHKAWKFYNQKHVNFSYCPQIDEERFFNMFETLSDVYYYRAYYQQPTLFAEEPFPNFSDALGKMFAMAASSLTHLEKLKLIEPGSVNKEMRINRLYWQGLRTIFLLPVFYVLDRYRIDVLDGKLNISDNCAYWQLTEMYTGAEPPIMRSNEDFDAPAKLLVEVDDQYTSQIMSTVLQFQLFKHFCEITGQYKKGDPLRPLDLCDLSNQRRVGPLIYEAMSLGASRSYKEVLRIMTNKTVISMDGLLEYFQPLYEWLVNENRKKNIDIGWIHTTKCNP